MSSGGQILGGIVGGVIGFIGTGGSLMGAVKGFAIGSSIGGMIDPPPGPDLKGPTLEDRSFNSAAYGVSLATLHGTIAHTGSIIYLENNEYKAVAKKQKTGGKGGGSKGSYTTTTYFATFAVAIGEAMPGSKLRRIWAGGKLIYSVGESVDWETLMQSAATAGQRLWSPPGTEFPEDDVPKWHYYDGTQNEPDTRMEAVLGVGSCPSYEGTAYIIFYDFDLTEYGNGLQGCPIKVEVIADFETEVDEQPFQKVFESITKYDGYLYDPVSNVWRENDVYVRALTPSGAQFIEQEKTYGAARATYRIFSIRDGWFKTFRDYNADIQVRPGLTFDDSLHWQEFDPTSGTMPNDSPGWAVAGWAQAGGIKMVYGDYLHAGSFEWSDETVLGAAYGNGNYYIINNSHIIKLSPSGVVLLSRVTDSASGTSYKLWFDSNILYRFDVSGGAYKLWSYDTLTLDTLEIKLFGSGVAPDAGPGEIAFAVYSDVVVIGWAKRSGPDGGKIHYEIWRIKNFNIAQKISLDKIVGRHMSAAGVTPEFRDLTALENDYVDGYRITDATSARGKIGPLQVAYLFDLVEYGYTIKAIKRGGEPIVTIPYSDFGARAAGDSPGALMSRERETDSQLPSRFTLTFLDYNREYDPNTEPADYPSRFANERNQTLPIVLTANNAAQLADVLINLAWIERDTFSFVVPQKYLYLKPANIINVEIAPGIFAVMRIRQINYTADQRIEITAKRADSAIYQSGAVGATIAPPNENISLVAASLAVILDIPAVATGTTDYGFGAVMGGGPGWKGGALLRSIDSGQTYDAIQAFTANCTIARAVNYLPAGDYFVIDRNSELEINLFVGDFFSITEAQMLTGKNYCAYGADGRWEIMQYANATLVGSTVMLSTFVRGLFGSEWAGDLHQPGDMIVLLDDPDNAFIGADAVALNSPRKFKGVTTGQDIQLAAEIDFTYRGVNLKPLAPVHVKGSLVAGVWTFRCSRRSRMSSSQWSTGVAAPVGEVSLLFDYEIYEGGVLKNIYQSTDEFIYSQAAQLSDFGYLPTSLTVKIFQISGAIGRGYPAEKSLSASGANYGNFVALLLHFNGVNASTNFVDSSLYSHVFAAVGNARISTAQSQFGGASGEFYGGYIKCPDNAAFNFGVADFTIQFWARPVSIAANGEICAHRAMVDNNNFYLIRLNATTGKIRVFAIAAGVTVTDITSNVGLALSVNTHVAIVRKNGVCKIFIAGINSDTVAVNAATAWPSVATDFVVGAGGSSGSSYLSAFIDDFSVVNGVAIHSVDFTPPATQFEDPV